MDEPSSRSSKKAFLLAAGAAILGGGGLGFAFLRGEKEEKPVLPVSTSNWVPEIRPEPIRESSGDLRLVECGWAIAWAEGGKLRAIYALAPPGPRGDRAVFFSSSSLKKLLAWAESTYTMPAARLVGGTSIPTTSQISFLNRSLVGVENGVLEKLYIGIAVTSMGQVEYPPPRAISIRDLPDAVRGFVRDLDQAAWTAVRADLAKRTGSDPVGISVQPPE